MSRRRRKITVKERNQTEEDDRYDRLNNFCNNIDNNFSNFKTNDAIVEIIETVPKKFGDLYLQNIINNKFFKDINWDYVQKINDIGGPRNYEFDIINKKILLSPTTLRYVQFTLEIVEHILEKNLNNIEIVEIGGGYGAQACLFFMFSDKFIIKKYTILDLEPVNKLQRLFIHNFNEDLNIECLDLDKYTGKSDFIISNYALGELRRKTQDLYFEKVFPHIKNGFICWNFSVGNQIIHPYFDKIDKQIVEENPQTNCHPVKSYNIKF